MPKLPVLQSTNFIKDTYQGFSHRQQSAEHQPIDFVVQHNSIQMLPDLWELKCQTNASFITNVKTSLALNPHHGNVHCLPTLIHGERKANTIADSSQRLHSPASVCQGAEVFLLPDIHDLQGMTVQVVNTDISVTSKDQAFIAACGIIEIQPTSDDNQSPKELGWHAELGKAIQTLSALQIVDLGKIDDE